MYKIMIADDEPIVLDSLKTFPWSDHQCCVTCFAENGLNALHTLESEKVDILISDIRMPGMNGLELSQALKKLYPDMDVRSIRGNLQTRLRKLDEGQYSALILAAAGLKRLGLESRINRYFTADEIIPAAGQGILAVQGRKGEAYDFLEGYCDKDAWTAGSAERAFVKLLDGGCSSPVAAHAEILGDEIYLRGLYYNEKDGSYVTGTLRGNKADAESLGRELAETLRKKGENR